MKRYLKAAVALACVAFLYTEARAENYVIPRDNNGQIPADINLVGGDVFVSTSADAFGSTVPVMLYGFSVSSDVVTNFATLRDTNTLNTTSNIKLTLYPNGSNSQGGGAQTITTRLPIPVYFRNGLSINLNKTVVGALGGNSGTASRGRWMFYIRYMPAGSIDGRAPAFPVDNVGVN